MVVQNVKYTWVFPTVRAFPPQGTKVGTDLHHENNFLEFSAQFFVTSYTGLQTVLWLIFLPVRVNFVSDRAGATTTLPHLISAAISVAYEKHQTASETKLVKPRYSFELCSADRLSARISAAQTNFSELRTGLLRKQCWFCDTYCTVLRDPVRSTWIRCRMNNVAVSSSEKHSNSAQKSVINRSNSADI